MRGRLGGGVSRRLRPSSRAAIMDRALAWPMPLNRVISARLSCPSLVRLLSTAESKRLDKLTAFSSALPIPIKMANNSASDNCWRPILMSFSRGRSSSAQAVMGRFSSGSFMTANLGDFSALNLGLSTCFFVHLPPLYEN